MSWQLSVLTDQASIPLLPTSKSLPENDRLRNLGRGTGCEGAFPSMMPAGIGVLLPDRRLSEDRDLFGPTCIGVSAAGAAMWTNVTAR